MNKKVIIKHVVSTERMREIQAEQKQEDIVHGLTTRRNTLELKDKIIHFVIWYNLKKVWDHVNGYMGAGEIDFSDIDKEIDSMKRMAHFRKDLHEKYYNKSEELVNAN